MTQTPRRRRTGFSLIELLVVIAIMTILAALLAAAVLKMLSVPPQKNTELLIQKLTSSLEQQWTAVITQCKTEAIPPVIWQQAMTAAGGDPQKAMDQYIKWRLIQEFPESLAQAANPAPLPPKAIFQGLTNPAVPPPATLSGESSMLLYVTLSVGRRGMDFDASSLSPKEARQVSTGVFVLYDGWDQPLQFKNNVNTTGKFEIRSAGPRRVLGDADDVTSDMLRLGR